MRLRNIPGAKDAILDCEWVVDEPERFKGKWDEVFGVKRPLFLEVGMGKGRFLMDIARLHPERCMTVCFFGRCRRERNWNRQERSFPILFLSGWMQDCCRRFLRRMRLMGSI